MKTDKVFIKYFAVPAAVTILIAGLLLSCRKECFYKPTALALIDFHSVVNGQDQQSPISQLSVYGLGREDSLLYLTALNIRRISLPVNGSAEETGFVLLFEEARDTIWISYKVVPYFLSEECGFMLNFDLHATRHTSHIIDSVVIVTKEITSFDDTNIRLYH